MLEFPFTAVRFHKYILRRIDRSRTGREYEDRGEGGGERGEGRGGVGGLEQECDGKTQHYIPNITHKYMS